MITPTLLTAAVAGVLSAVLWPMAWTRFGGAESAMNIELIVATLLVVAFPAHALVVGFGYNARQNGGKFDSALFKRVGAWLLAALLTSALSSAWLR